VLVEVVLDSAEFKTMQTAFFERHTVILAGASQLSHSPNSFGASVLDVDEYHNAPLWDWRNRKN
jgi:hypothetical protein